MLCSASAQYGSKERVPRPGDSLYILGSNKDTLVGTPRSVAEPSGTDEAVTLGLALARLRGADSIERMDSQIPSLAASRREPANVCGNRGDPRSYALKVLLNAATRAPAVILCKEQVVSYW